MGVFLTDHGNMSIIVQKEGNVLLWQADAGIVKQRFTRNAMGPWRSLILATQWDVMKKYSKDKQH